MEDSDDQIDIKENILLFDDDEDESIGILQGGANSENLPNMYFSDLVTDGDYQILDEWQENSEEAKGKESPADLPNTASETIHDDKQIVEAEEMHSASTANGSAEKEAPVTQEASSASVVADTVPSDVSSPTQDVAQQAKSPVKDNSMTYTEEPVVDATPPQAPVEEPVVDATPPQKPVKDATPTQKPVKDATPTQKPVKDATPTQKPVKDATPTQKPVKDATPTQKPVEDANPPQEQVKDVPPTQKSVEDATPPQEQVKDVHPPQKPVKDVPPPQEQVTQSKGVENDSADESSLKNEPKSPGTPLNDEDTEPFAPDLVQSAKPVTSASQEPLCLDISRRLREEIAKTQDLRSLMSIKVEPVIADPFAPVSKVANASASEGSKQHPNQESVVGVQLTPSVIKKISSSRDVSSKQDKSLRKSSLSQSQGTAVVSSTSPTRSSGTSAKRRPKSPSTRKEKSPIRSSSKKKLHSKKSVPLSRKSTSPSKRPRSPRRWSRSPHRRSRSPHQRSRSPRKRSRSPRKRSRSPRRRSRSPQRRSGSPIVIPFSPQGWSRSPQMGSRSSWRASRSPQRRSVSPCRASTSPQRGSVSPWRPSRSPQRMSRSPERWTMSPQRRPGSPQRRSRSPQRRSRSPPRRSRSTQRRSRSPQRRSRSPQRRSRSPQRRSRSPQRWSRSPHRRSRSPQRRSKLSWSPHRRSRSPFRMSRSPQRRSRSPLRVVSSHQRSSVSRFSRSPSRHYSRSPVRYKSSRSKRKIESHRSDSGSERSLSLSMSPSPMGHKEQPFRRLPFKTESSYSAQPPPPGVDCQSMTAGTPTYSSTPAATNAAGGPFHPVPLMSVAPSLVASMPVCVAPSEAPHNYYMPSMIQQQPGTTTPNFGMAAQDMGFATGNPNPSSYPSTMQAQQPYYQGNYYSNPGMGTPAPPQQAYPMADVTVQPHTMYTQSAYPAVLVPDMSQQPPMPGFSQPPIPGIQQPMPGAQQPPIPVFSEPPVSGIQPPLPQTSYPTPPPPPPVPATPPALVTYPNVTRAPPKPVPAPKKETFPKLPDISIIPQRAASQAPKVPAAPIIRSGLRLINLSALTSPAPSTPRVKEPSEDEDSDDFEEPEMRLSSFLQAVVAARDNKHQAHSANVAQSVDHYISLIENNEGALEPYRFKVKMMKPEAPPVRLPARKYQSILLQRENERKILSFQICPVDIRHVESHVYAHFFRPQERVAKKSETASISTQTDPVREKPVPPCMECSIRKDKKLINRWTQCLPVDRKSTSCQTPGPGLNHYHNPAQFRQNSSAPRSSNSAPRPSNYPPKTPMTRW